MRLLRAGGEELKHTGKIRSSAMGWDRKVQAGTAGWAPCSVWPLQCFCCCSLPCHSSFFKVDIVWEASPFLRKTQEAIPLVFKMSLMTVPYCPRAQGQSMGVT